MEDGASEYEVEKILDHKKIRGVQHYLVKWLGYSNEENTWEPANGLGNCHEVIDEYWRGKSGVKGRLSATSSRRSSGSDIVAIGKRTASDNNSISSSISGKKRKGPNDIRSLDSKITAIANNSNVSESEDKLTSDDDDDEGSAKSSPSKLRTRLVGMQAERDRKAKSRGRANSGNRNLAGPKSKASEKDSDSSLSTMPEKILGATKSKGKLYFMVKWKNSNNVSVVPAEKMNKTSPHLVIQFYEARIVWLQHCKSNDSDDGDNDVSIQGKSVT